MKQTLSSSLVLLVAGVLGVAGRSTLDRRAPGTTAVCDVAFSWLDSSNELSPCYLAAIVSSACAGNTWNVPAINATTHYSTPSVANQTANTCQCSWIAYNLFGACSVCQDFPASVVSWGAWSLECSGQIPDTPFPKVPLNDGTLIPYYATVDPSTWTDQRFNALQSQNVVREGHADVSQTGSTNQKQSPPVGPIVGGVVGGLAALGLAGAAIFYIRRQKKRPSIPPTAPSTISDGTTTFGYGSPAPLGHNRNPSDMSTKTVGTVYQNIGNSFVTSLTNTRGPASSTMHTHTGSVNSLSYFGSVNNSVAPYSMTASPPPVTLASAPSPPPLPHVPAERANIVTPFPFTSTQRSPTPTHPVDRKRADGAIIPVYDSPNSLSSDERGRSRINPPAYTDYSADRPLDASSQAPSRPMHTKKGSADTVTTLESPVSPSNPDSPVTYGTGVNTHISGIDDMIGQMGLGAGAATVSGTGGTLATGQSMRMQVTQRHGPLRPMNPGSGPEM